MDQDRNSRQVKKLCPTKLVIALLDDEGRGYRPVFMLKKRTVGFFLSSVFNKFKVAKLIVPTLILATIHFAKILSNQLRLSDISFSDQVKSQPLLLGLCGLE